MLHDMCGTALQGGLKADLLASLEVAKAHGGGLCHRRPQCTRALSARGGADYLISEGVQLYFSSQYREALQTKTLSFNANRCNK
jgi:hypothetical protein